MDNTLIHDTVPVCAILRNFESDSEHLSFDDNESSPNYIPFGHFWIQKVSEEDKREMCKDLNTFGGHWTDKYYASRWFYIGRGKSTTVLRDNSMVFFYPLFRAMKLYRTGDLLTPMGFYKWKDI
jgi:hypothetical protein